MDEQIVPFKGRGSLKHYNPQKPHKWGYKIYVISESSGFAYDFEIYSGKENNVLLDGERDCGASGNIIIRLARSIPSNLNHKLYFDNYFTNPEVQVFLAQRGIYALGTARCNRVANCTMMSDAELKKRGRGAICEKVSIIYNVKITTVRCYDNRIVNFLSSFVCGQPACEVTRWSKKVCRYEQVPCPNIVSIYNTHMGGVDLLDSLIGLYRCRLKSKKWYH